MHCDTAHAVARTRRAAEMLLAQKPDVVFLTGDYITDHPHRWAHQAAEALAPLAAVPGGVFCILGNHDWSNYHWLSRSAELVAQALAGVGFTVLRNEAAPLPPAPGVWVVGLDDRYAGREDVARALDGVPPDACRILLVHEPDYADEAPAGFALQLSGHSHGGQIRRARPAAAPLPQVQHALPGGLAAGAASSGLHDARRRHDRPADPPVLPARSDSSDPPRRPDMPPSSLTALISTIVAPVALITPTAILLGNYSSKYTAIAGQIRELTGEFRRAGTADARRKSIRQQLRLFHRRIAALWAASGALLMALLSFLVTVLALVFAHHTAHISLVAAASIVSGLLFILAAVVLELYEIGLARLTVAGELADVFEAETASELRQASRPTAPCAKRSKAA